MTTHADIEIGNISLRDGGPDLSKDDLPDNIYGHVMNKKLNRVLQLTLKGTMESEIYVSDKWGTHSFVFKFEDSADLAAITDIEEALLGAGDYKYKSIIKDDQIWIKLGTDRKKTVYAFAHNVPKFSPKNPAAAPLFIFQSVVATVDIGVYFNTKDEVCGLTMKLRDFQAGEVSDAVLV